MLQSLSRRLFLCTMGKWFYAVRVGRKPGIYPNWDDCKKQVDNFSGAKFRKFQSKAEALEFIGTTTNATPSIQQTHGTENRTTKQPSKPSASFASRSHRTQSTELVCLYCQSSSHTHSRCQAKRSYTTKRSMSTDYAQSNKRPKIDLNTADRVAVYTDGACTANGRKGAKAGLGVYWGPQHPKNVSERLQGRQTNQTAEIMAAVRALETAKEMNIQKLSIYTDSMFTINCITQWIHNWKRNGWKTKTGPVIHKDELIQLDKLCQEVNVSWVHVPGHRNIHGNEEADKLARAGAVKPLN